MDWERAARRRVTRRALLGAAGASAAALAAACSRGPGSKNSSPAARPGGTSPSQSTATRAAPTRPANAQQGETLKVTGYVTRDNSYDPHKTQAGPFYGQQALVFSRLLSYVDQAKGNVTADLAQGLPGQPDATTLVFSLNRNARWQERAPVNGRQVTANDVKASIERQRLGDPSFVRKAKWQVIDSVEAPDAGQVVIKLKEPRADTASLFADVNAFIVPEELASAEIGPNMQIGSGPFRWVEWSDDKFASVSRNPTWFGGNGRPFLDGVTVTQPKNTAEAEANLRTKTLDAVFVGRPQAENLKRAVPQLQEATQGQALFYGMRFFSQQFPFNDVRVRSAFSIALDRRAMVEKFFAGSGDVNPWISWPMTRWTLPPAELAAFPGYRPGSGGRSQDIADAKALLAAFTSAQALPETLALFVPDDAEKNLGIGSLIKQQLSDALGLNIGVYALPIGDLVRQMFSGNASWVAGPDNGWLDLDDWLYPYFHSAGVKNTFAYRNPDMDALIVSQRTQLDEGKRRDIGFEVQRQLLALQLGVNFVSERVVTLAQPYVRNFPLDTADGYQHRFADTWIDKNDPSFRGRS
ncbi:MAG: ABC transporter substrate-binding protein [Chloroflexi bacterium]|nr:ABC transporter substrate-binding protein [Chloroflexota bacterium]